ncbi:ABC transporter related [Beutenbergia cavernae DSM 12333]|uniref:ABC transporter related n=1 Tax=Beutenbergia cavernae (strain ATCC BAA-8 / DSM 12333 / CCUG 43141 / JCM 11478 / NBRC 16432 / NCIMB 13614 / HKI 0122) TaxID=471853 RepID=C5C3M2_BEUC1|nr:ABC transporter ATP-binding protein [Beutenbergia cavernae]ACQ81931.1 ABC transporter related [Beutenbergia cavernae DSM 12333]
MSGQTAENTEQGVPERTTREKARILWAYARPHKGVLAVALVLGALGVAAELATPLVTKAVLDGLEMSASLRTPITILAVLLVAGSVVGLIQGIMLGTLAERIILAARTGIVRHLLGARVPEVTARPPGELVTRVTSDTLLIREATTSSVVNFVNGLIGLVGAIVLMAYLDVVLLGTTVAVLVLVGICVVVLMPRLSKAQQEAQEHVGKLGGRLEGVVRALRTVKSARAETRETSRISAHAEDSARAGIRAVKLENVSWTITGAGVNLAVMLLLGVGAWRVSTGAITVTTLVAFLLYVFQLMMPVMLLTMALTSLQSGLAAAARISDVEDMELEADDDGAVASRAQVTDRAGQVATGSAGASPPEPPALRLRDVTYRYQTADGVAPALNGVSISVPRRGHTAIVGPSGAGKTTIMSLLLRFLTPEDGRIELDGRPYAEWTTDEIRSRIAYVEQDTPIVPGTLRENLAYAAPDASDARVWAAVDALRLSARVATMPDGLDTEVTSAELSGGERQRVAVARALVAQPEILLLDEATAQLDGLTEAALAGAIREVAATGAVVTIAHRLSTVVDADQIVLLERGRVRAVGRHAELLEADELYRELVAALRLDASVGAPHDEAVAGEARDGEPASDVPVPATT